MARANKALRIPDELVTDKIYLIRGQKVMMDRDLAELYNVETKRLKEAVRRNIDRFPEDFMPACRQRQVYTDSQRVRKLEDAICGLQFGKDGVAPFSFLFYRTGSRDIVQRAKQRNSYPGKYPDHKRIHQNAQTPVHP